MNFELTIEDLQLVTRALDSHVREHGLKVTPEVAAIVQKLQDTVDSGTEDVPDEGPEA